MSHISTETASTFINQALRNPDVRWKAASAQGGEWTDLEFQAAVSGRDAIALACANRVGTSEGVEKTPPYVKWTIRTLRETTKQVGARRNRIARLDVEAKIFRLDVFESGKGSYNQAQSVYDAIMDCVIGVPCTPVRVGNNLLANIVTSEFLDTHRRSYTNPDSIALVTEFGVVARLALEANF